jgi:hypothetical protein
MKTKWIATKIKYDGTQLSSLYAYLSHGVQGDSVIAFEGPCDVSFEHMVDGEDLLEKSAIQGSHMLHFIFEVFDRELVSGIFLQRLFASLVADQVFKETGKRLIRDGDDLFFGKKKLSISIATKTPVSVVIHFAMNVSNKGTPVETLSLEDLKIKPQAFAKSLLDQISREYESILTARLKVRPVY